MFLVPFDKKSILDDSTLSSQQQQQENQKQQQQQVRSTRPGTNSSFYGTGESINDSVCESVRFNEQGILTYFIDVATTFVERYLIKSLTALRRWLNFSFRALLAILEPILGKLPEAISSLLIVRPRSETVQATNNYRLVWPRVSSFATTELDLLTDSRNVCRYLAGTERVSLEHIKSSNHFIISPTNTTTDYHQDMDLCRRKSARRAASNNTSDDFQTEAATSRSSYWQFLPSALAHIAGAGGASGGAIARPPDRSEQLAVTAADGQRGVMEFQGQQQPRRRRSCGLQIEASGSSSGGMQEPGEYLLQHQTSQQELRTSPPRAPKYHSLCTAAPSLMSALHSLQRQQQQQQQQHFQLQQSPEQQQQQKENNNNNSAMNFNAQRLQHNHLHQHQHQQQQQQCSRSEQRSNGTDGGGFDQVAVDGGNGETSMVLVSKSALNNLTDQIAFSMNKMKHLEEQVRVIPDLQRRLDHVLVVQTNDNNGATIEASKYQQQMQREHAARLISDHAASGQYSNSQYSSNLSFNESNDGSLVNNGALRRRSNTNIASDELISTGAIHPSLQRHYNSFRQYSANKATIDVQRRDSISSYRRSPTVSANQANRLSTRSPTAAQRDYNGASQVFEHLNDRFGRSGTGANNSVSPRQHSLQFSSPKHSAPCKSNHQEHSINGGVARRTDVSSHKAEYQDLINDLISLTYSVNYLSSSNSVQSSTSSGGRKSCGISKTADSSPLHQVSISNHQQQDIPPAAANPPNGSRRHFTTSAMGTTKLDCGCQSFKEHLRYNSISREQRLNSYNQNHNNLNNYHSRSRSSSATTINPTPVNIISPLHVNQIQQQPATNKVDASTNTELTMDDIVTKVDLDSMVTSMQKTYSTLSSIGSHDEETSQFKSVIMRHQKSASTTVANHLSSTSPTSTGSGSFSEPKSSTTPPPDSSGGRSSDSCGVEDDASECSSNKGIVDEDEVRKSSMSDDVNIDEDDSDLDDDDEGKGDDDIDRRSPSCGEPYSLGSSYQDPSDFEEYCAYGESLDRRTKDFMSQTTKIPNDLRFALIRLNDYIKRKHSFEKIESSSGCVEVIRKEWFKVAANNDSQATKTKLYVDYFESFTKQLLNSVVNLSDSAGNTAMHYAASHNKLDIIKVLLDTKVCDINRRNKAGYTPIMLLALTDIEDPAEQEVARHLFSLGDVNIKSRTSGQTAIMLAASHGRLATVKLLLECGADPSMQDFDGSTALMCGSEMGHEEIVSLLLAHKLTDPNATDNDGLDALTIAMNNGHKNIGLMLYAAKNVPRMVRSSMSAISNNNNNINNQTFICHQSAGGGGYLGASLRRSRGKLAANYVKRADSLLGSRSNSVRPLIRHSVDS